MKSKKVSLTLPDIYKSPDLLGNKSKDTFEELSRDNGSDRDNLRNDVLGMELTIKHLNIDLSYYR
jgi:hypothetical protein